MNKKISFNISILIILIACMLLSTFGIVIGYYNYPAFDDFARGTMDNLNYLQGLKAWYLHHNGRFTNAMISEWQVLYKYQNYRLLAPSLFIFWSISIISLIISYLKLEKVFHWKYGIFLVSTIILSVIAAVPNIAQFWFWFASSSVYMFASSLLLFTCAINLYLIKEKKSSIFYYIALILSCLLAYFTSGTHEMAMLSILAINICFTILYWFRFHSLLFLLPFLSSIAGALTLILSPGSQSRLDKVSGQNVLFSILSKFNDVLFQIIPVLAKAIIFWFKNSQLIALFLIVFIFSISMKRQRRFSLKHIFSAWFLLLITTLIAIATVPIMLDGQVHIDDATRLASFAWFIFLLFWVLLSDLLANFVNRWIPEGYTGSKSYAFLLIISSILFCYFSFMQTNSNNLINDISQQRHTRQYQDIEEWHKRIKSFKNNPTQHQDKILVLGGLTDVASTHVNELGLSSDSNYYLNKMFAKYHGLNIQVQRKNFDSLLLKYITENATPIKTNINGLKYHDKYRDYLLIQVPTRPFKDDTICLELASKIDGTLYDEEFINLEFEYKNGQYCSDFVSRTMYCDDVLDNWFCRIPIPHNYNEHISIIWMGKLTKIEP